MLFRSASVRQSPLCSKRLFESAVQDHYSKMLDSATLCFAPFCSALLAPCMPRAYPLDMHASTLVHTSSCLTANPATALQPGWFEDSLSLNFRLPGSPTHEGKFPTHVPGNCMHRGLQEHRWETAFGSFLYDPVLWARPGWFEDSFSLKCWLPGNAG